MFSRVFIFFLYFVLANSSSVLKAGQKCFLPDSYPQILQDFFCNKPFFVWLVPILTLIITVIAVLGNLTTTIEFFQKKSSRKKTELAEEKLLRLRKQLLTSSGRQKFLPRYKGTK